MEWLGQVPEHWEVKPLKYAATHNDEALDEGFPADSEIAYIDISGVDAVTGIAPPEIIQFGEAPSRARRRVKDGDVIVSTVRTYLRAIARIQHPPENLIVSTGFAVVRPMDNSHPGFVGFLMSAGFFIENVIARSTGVSYPAINASELVRIEIPLPPLAEQTAIADFLDRETAKIDGLIAEQERLIELLKEKRQAVISLAVTKGLNPDAPMKDSGIEWLNEIPAHWSVVSFKHLARGGGKTFTDGDWIESPFITSDGVRLLQTGNVGIGNFKEQGYRYVSEDTFSKLQCTEVNPRDVLICRLDGPVGRACLAPDLGVRMITSVDNAILKVADNVSPEHVVSMLSSVPWISWIDALCRVGGGFRLRISRSQLGEIRVPLPPINEQLAIRERLGSLGQEFDILTTEAQKAITLLQERRSALISAAVTGQIDVRSIHHQEAA